MDAEHFCARHDFALSLGSIFSLDVLVSANAETVRFSEGA